jgi:hypothetical protein
LPLFVSASFLGALLTTYLLSRRPLTDLWITLHAIAGLRRRALDGPYALCRCWRGALFIAPFFLFSGCLQARSADRVDKAAIARWVKVVEIGDHGDRRRGGLCVESVRPAVPRCSCSARTRRCSDRSNTRMLPQHLAAHELVAGNALIEAGTFLAILIGTIRRLGAGADAGRGWTVGRSAVVRGVGGGTPRARSRPRRPPARTRGRALTSSPTPSSWCVTALGRRRSAGPVLGISWFWMVGSTFVSARALRARRARRRRARGDADARGVRDRRRLGSCCASACCAASSTRGRCRCRRRRCAVRDRSPSRLGRPRGRATRSAGIGARLASPANWRVLGDLSGSRWRRRLHRPALRAHPGASEPSHRARVIAANNVVNAIA